MTNKEFFDEEFYKKMLLDYEDIRQRRNARKGRPSVEDLAIIAAEREFERFYRRFL